MKTLKELIMSTLNFCSLKRFLCLLFVCVMGVFFISSSFISCTPGVDDRASVTGENGEEGTSRRRRSSSDDDDDDDEGDECKGNETCERICEHIYEIYKEKIDCMGKGDVKVAKLEKIHDLLMENFDNEVDLKRNLDKISEEDDVDRDDFGDYLKIGGTKWQEEIEKGLLGKDDQLSSAPADKRKRLITVLEWFITDDNQRAAKILSAENDGNKILEALILTLYEAKENVATCISDSTVSTPLTLDDSTDLWGLDVSVLKVGYAYQARRDIGEISLKRQNTNLYDALSCLYDEVGSGNKSVFSESINKNNGTIFDMAFDLLNTVCEDLLNSDNNRNVACRKALFCWMAANGSSDLLDKDFVENKKNQLEVSGGESNYKYCNADGFYEFFLSRSIYD